MGQRHRRPVLSISVGREGGVSRGPLGCGRRWGRHAGGRGPGLRLHLGRGVGHRGGLLLPVWVQRSGRPEAIALSRPGSCSGFSFELGPCLRNLGAIRALSSGADRTQARGGAAARGAAARAIPRRVSGRSLRPPAARAGTKRARRPGRSPASAARSGSSRRAFGSRAPAPAAARSPERLTGLRGPRPARPASASCPPPPPLRHLPPARRPSRSAPPRGAGLRAGPARESGSARRRPSHSGGRGPRGAP